MYLLKDAKHTASHTPDGKDRGAILTPEAWAVDPVNESLAAIKGFLA